MKGELLRNLQAQVYREVFLQCNDRIVLVEPADDHWPSLELANHNIFRLDANNRVVWQVRREEKGHMNWEILHELAKHKHAEGDLDGCYTANGFMDPFFNMGLDETGALAVEPTGTYRPGCKVYLSTRWWSYELDVETGIATCTGNQMK